MKKWLLIIGFVFSLALPADALEISPPVVPESGAEIMPENTSSFSDGLAELVSKAIRIIRPDLSEAVNVCISILCTAVVVSVLRGATSSIERTTDLAGMAAVSGLMLGSANSMLQLASETLQELGDYGRLFYPVMATALAAQGGVSSSAALYTGTALLDALFCSFISKAMLPTVCIFLALSCANSAIGEDYLKRMRDLVKNGISWFLKTALTVYTTYMSITGVVSGTTDAAALKATKVTISSVVPVVGGILSDASEAVLVSAELMKNAAGIYGILAVLAVFVSPFLKISVHYLLLKLTAAVCSLFGTKTVSGLVDDFGCAMGLLLAMTGTVCLLLLISTVCFMKGVGQ